MVFARPFKEPQSGPRAPTRPRSGELRDPFHSANIFPHLNQRHDPPLPRRPQWGLWYYVQKALRLLGVRRRPLSPGSTYAQPRITPTTGMRVQDSEAEQRMDKRQGKTRRVRKKKIMTGENWSSAGQLGISVG